jgi:predicted kinase
LRAAIRAKVTAARLARADANSSTEIARTAEGYFHLACQSLEPTTPTLIAIGGLSGTGKSLLARNLAPELVPSPGAEIERFPIDAYAPEITAQVYAALKEKARRIVSADFSAIVDAVFADSCERTAIRAAADGIHVKFYGLFLAAPLPIRLKRVGSRSRDASDADEAVAHRQESYALGEIDFTEIDASGNPADTLARAKAALRRP